MTSHEDETGEYRAADEVTFTRLHVFARQLIIGRHKPTHAPCIDGHTLQMCSGVNPSGRPPLNMTLDHEWLNFRYARNRHTVQWIDYAMEPRVVYKTQANPG